ncbi:SDR family NAD(P)-dependent oxidoreductase [Streptomyces klenkii]|uniref:SDR family NAD(P)-dependent oxidoreductase n=1 Tax=Streptomyces klenkii TaxID=1420899 RepID=UPI00341C90B2
MATSEVVADGTAVAIDTAVAIVGVGLRLPGAITSLDGLWSVLADGLDVVEEMPADRFDKAAFTDRTPGRAGKAYTAAGGFLKQDIASFDAGFFAVSPKEASRIDPQQRLLLECAVEAFDDAGIDPAELAGADVSVIMGVSSHDYADLQQRRIRSANAYTNSGTASCNAANRLSYFFDFQGPSVAVDTACSSALTAVHQACETLRSGRSRVALAGGVNVLLSPAVHIGFSAARMLSPTGRCRPFSADADGYVRAEGAGVLVLKPLDAALADGDRLHAVIAGSGTNADGRTSGLALPNPQSQAALLRQVYAAAGIDPREVAYVEAHGTGTQAGDPVECRALGEVLGRNRGDQGALPVGSVKSNLGHLEAASGMAGLAKALLVLRERRIPATLHAGRPSERIDFAGLGLEPVACGRPLTVTGRGVVGINSFGFGGANAHVVLAPPPRAGLSAPDALPSADGDARFPLLVTARSRQALDEMVRQWAERLETADPSDLYDVAYTASRRRACHEQRVAVLAAAPKQAAAALRAVAEGAPAEGTAVATAVRRGRVAFVFNGNGSQWVGMGRGLLATDRAFRSEVAAVDGELTPLLGWSVLEELAAPHAARWMRTEVTQPLLFAVQAGLVAALAARGVSPSAVCGHSVGEVAAAYAAGALDRTNACRVIAVRSRAQGPTAGAGRMAAVGVGIAQAEALLAEVPGAESLVVAAVNSDRDVTVAGGADALAALARVAGDRDVFFRDLELEYAFHSPAMDPLQQALKNALATLTPRSSDIPMLSTVTGREVDGTALDADYWWRNVREPVDFAGAVGALTGPDAGCDVLVEVGPDPVLRTYLRRAGDQVEDLIAVVPTLSRSTGDSSALDTALARLLAVGADVDWMTFFPRPGRVVDLPSYAWQRERHYNGHPDWWLETATGGSPRRGRHPLLGLRQPGPDPVWRLQVEPGPLAWVADHTIGEAVVVPAAAYVEMALSAGREVFDGPAEVTRLSIDRALALPFGDPAMDVCLHTALAEDGSFAISSRTGEGGDWVEHVRGRVQRLLRDRPAPVPVPALRAHLPRTLCAEDHYAACTKAGLDFGPAFRTLTAIKAGEGEFLIDYAATMELDDQYTAHPTVLDVAFQGGQPLMMAITGDPVPFLPVGVEAVRCWQPMPSTGAIHLRARAAGSREASWDITIADTDGFVALELIGCRARRFDGHRAAEAGRLTEVLRAMPLPGQPTAPASLPAPAQILAAGTDGLTGITERWHTHSYAQVQDRGLNLAAHFTAAAVQELLPGRETFCLDDLFGAGVARAHARLLPALLDMAVTHGTLISPRPDRWRPAAVPAPRRVFRDALRRFPEEASSALVYGICGLHLADVLRGTTDPLSLLFSGPDPLAARFYDSSPVIAYHSRIAGNLVRTLVAGWPADRPLRVLEVGAGTGGTTAALLAHLPPELTHYTYTDVSPSFFPAAQQRFAQYDFLDYRRLDLDTDPAEQGFTPGSFDLVIAANVLHATRDLTRALRRVADLLVDDGHLLAIETHNPQVMLPVFGLLESYWATDDRELRPDGPLLAREQWPTLLDECGFAGTVQAGDSREPARSDYSVILTARRPRTTDLPPPTAQLDAAHPDALHRRWLIAGTDSEADASTHAVAEALQTRVGAAHVSTVRAERDAGVWARLLGSTDGPTDVVLLTAPSGELSPARITDRAVDDLAVLRALASACRQLPEHRQVALWLITPGVRNDDRLRIPAATDTVAASMWGAARSLANEQPRLTVRRIGVLTANGPDAGGPSEANPWAEGLAHELLARSEHDEVLLTAHGRFVPRVKPVSRPVRLTTASSRNSYTLRLREPGLHYRLEWQEAAEPVPGPGEVVVEVAAAALNYRDIMMATGRVPVTPSALRPEVEAIGLECAGTVIAVGPDVTAVAPGDRVLGGAGGCFASHALIRADRVMPIPEDMTFAQAATMPMLFMTTYHSLHHLARLTAGETLLIHSAAGGVGLAALRHAQLAGARVIATAGTEAKRDLLHLLGVEHVLDSRSLRFADQVMDLTNGRGVDVVLNSLAEEAQIRSLGLLKPHGRFIELGKRDFLNDNPLPQAPFIRNLAFFGVDISPFIDEPAPLADRHIQSMREALQRGDYGPLPHRVYPASRIHEAFAAMQHSRHIGKIVLTFDEPVPVQPLTTSPAMDPQATYLITGGFSGLGAAVARYLATRGACHLTLVGRRGPATPEGPALIAELRNRGVQVEAQAVDATDGTALRELFDRIDASGRRLAGVFHAAMVLDDADLTDLTDDRIRSVLAPKITAGHTLDRLTRDRGLDFFLACSSAAALVGNLKQASYAAANLALEALVHDRRRAGLPGQAVQWGAIADTGYVHRTGLTQEMANLGLGALSTSEAMAALDTLLTRDDITTTAVGHFHWDRLRQFLHTLTTPRTRSLLPTRHTTEASDQLRTALATADEQKALALIEDALADLLSHALQTKAENIDRGHRLDQLGMDSLMSAEFATHIRNRLGCELPVVELAGAPSLTALARRVLNRLRAGAAASAT